MLTSMSTAPGERREPKPAAAQVVHVVSRDVFTRFGRMVRHVLVALRAEGVNVTLLTDDPAAAAELEGTPVVCHTLSSLCGWRAWHLPSRLARLIDAPPDLVHLWGTACLPAIGAWLRRHGVPCFVHALAARDVPQLPRAGSRMHFAAGCAGLLQAARARCGAALASVTVRPPGFLMPDEPRGDDCDGASRTLGVLWTGRIVSVAGLETLVDAVAQLRRRCDLQVALLGSGPGLAALTRRVYQAGVQDCVSLVDAPRLWDQAMHGADVCVVPARQDDLCLAPLLAMAMGKIVIASSDQLAEWFIEDQTAWQFTPGSAVELAYHLERAAGRHPRGRELSASARAYVRSRHTLAPFIAGLLTEYHAATGKQFADVPATTDTAAGGRGT